MSLIPPPELAEVLRAGPVPQRAFRWTPEQWTAQLHDQPELLQVLARLPERVDRGFVREHVLTEVAAGRTLSAFVAAMIWGYGDQGYGATRVRWILTGTKGRDAISAPIRAEVTERLSTAVEVVRADGAIAGFRHMNNAGRVKHLASAFFTKWLYFVSALDGIDDPEAAPILDKQVQNWLSAHADLHLDIHRTPDYQRYVEVLSTWGEMHQCSPVQVEKAVFGLATGR